ncbi:MAG: hypothetical protein QNJ72_14315 [Pleurocapsa sp. MO_226.B13]|nr:hypothetical protein [Pleurocapsa sp. MO_226.B13]
MNRLEVLKLSVATFLATLFGGGLLIGATFSGSVLGLNEIPNWLYSYLGLEITAQEAKQCPDPTCDP